MIKALKVIKVILKVLLATVIIGFLSFAIIRIFVLDTYPAEMQKYIWTEKSKECYSSHPDNFHIYDVYVGQNYSRLGYFFNSYIRLTDCEKDNHNELQITVRYNDSTLSHLEKDKGITPQGDDPFIYVLSTNKGNYYLPDSSITGRKSNLNYRRLVYADIDMTDVEFLYINIYARGEKSEQDILNELKKSKTEGIDETAFSYMPIFSSKNVNKEYKLKKDEFPN